LPRGIQSAVASPDGKHFAIVADRRPFDSLEDVRHVIDAGQSSLYVVNTDGTGGRWWCSDLKSIANEMAWSADGNSIAVLSQLPHIGYHRVSTAIDVCSVSTTRHVTDVPNSGGSIAWADDGKEIAFLSTTSEVLTPEHIWTAPPPEAAPKIGHPGSWALHSRWLATRKEEFGCRSDMECKAMLRNFAMAN
jgi:hypothetical protein